MFAGIYWFRGLGTAVLAHAAALQGGQDAANALIHPVDLRYVLLKTLVSALLVAVSTYHLAMAPKRSGQAVGQAVNSSIVVGIFLVLAVHAFLTLFQFG